MSPIIDTLYADPNKLPVLLFQFFRGCHLDGKISSVTSHRFVVVVPDELEERYFDFLIDNDLAMSSMNFLLRLHDDAEFAKRVVERMEKQDQGEPAFRSGGPGK